MEQAAGEGVLAFGDHDEQWDAFANRFGVTVVASVEPEPGVEADRMHLRPRRACAPETAFAPC